MKKTKPKPKLKKPVRRVRRSPYGRALEMATKRYDKARTEYIKCQNRIAALEQEIPRLSEMKRVLEGYMHGKPGPESPIPPLPESMTNLETRPPRPPVELPPGIAERIPVHLRHFIVPHPSIARGSNAQGGVVATALPPDNDDDQFLPNPTGRELLP